jgi:hypothetical protein
MQIQRHDVKIISMVIGGAIGLILFLLSGYQLLEFTDSVAFCGQLCHNVMYPEYTAHEVSPHSNVACADCHVGPGASYLVKSKISGVRLIVNTLTGDYPRPIPTPVTNLRPARETCERCHRPENFSGDIVQVHVTYATDAANTSHVDTRVLRVGGGEAGSAKGIHWHIASKVYYVPMDDSRQVIGWVGVDNSNGILTEYIDPTQASVLTPEFIAKNKRLMDCIDCHNRATHIFSSPNDLIDTAMQNGLIDPSLPYIKKEGLSALDPPNPSLDAAYARVEAIKDYYKQNYPQAYQQKGAAINTAVNELKNIAQETTFPDMKVTWNTYPDNIGHINSPGCFRCHGKLVATNGSQKGQTISADCQLCHYSNINEAFPQ